MLTDRRTDMTRLIVVFFVNTPKKLCWFLFVSIHIG